MDAMTTQTETPVIEITLTNCFHVKHPRQYHESAEGLCDSREAALAYAEGLQKYEYPDAVIIDNTTEGQAEEFYRTASETRRMAFHFGSEARRAGKLRTANPHPFASTPWQYWREGWNEIDEQVKAHQKLAKKAARQGER